jgi:hypothetical protein
MILCVALFETKWRLINMDKNEFSTVNDCHMVTHYDVAELRKGVVRVANAEWDIGHRLGQNEHISARLKEIEETLKHLHIDLDAQFPSTTEEANARDNAMTWLMEAIENVRWVQEYVDMANNLARKSATDARRDIDHLMHNLGV